MVGLSGQCTDTVGLGTRLIDGAEHSSWLARFEKEFTRSNDSESNVMQLRGVVILEKLYKAKYILRIKYKIPFSSKFKKNNIPCKLNTEIRFLELSI